MYVSLMALWKYFHYSPKRAESLKAIQSVLDLPELKIAKPSDTRWLAHERCVKAVKASYAAIVVALDNIHENTHGPEALGLSKSLSKRSTVAAIYMLRKLLLSHQTNSQIVSDLDEIVEVWNRKNRRVSV